MWRKHSLKSYSKNIFKRKELTNDNPTHESTNSDAKMLERRNSVTTKTQATASPTFRPNSVLIT